MLAGKASRPREYAAFTLALRREIHVMCATAQKKNNMARPPMSLEDLGLLCLLEKVEVDDSEMDVYARHGLMQEGLIQAGSVPSLTKKGAARLDELRAWREEGERRGPRRPKARKDD
jgi:hypothetical protein